MCVMSDLLEVEDVVYINCSIDASTQHTSHIITKDYASYLVNQDFCYIFAKYSR